MKNKDVLYLGSVTLILLFIPTIIFAQVANETRELYWWEIISGIIAIPVTLIGLTYSFILIKKTRAETRKIELEINEKEKGNENISIKQNIERESNFKTVLESRQIQLLLLRFALFYVVLQLWKIIESVFHFLFIGIGLGIKEFFGYDIENSWIVYPTLIFIKFPEVIYWTIIVGFGWPLLRDINKLLKISFKYYFIPWRK